MIIYTSGSTGFPKGVMMTHRNIVAAATSITTYLENREDDVILGVLPLSFDYGLYQVLMALKVGATLVLEKSFTFPQMILNRVAEEKVTGLPLVPTMAAIILQLQGPEAGALPAPALHHQHRRGAAAGAYRRACRSCFPRRRLYSMYGLTECKRCTYLPPGRARAPARLGRHRHSRHRSLCRRRERRARRAGRHRRTGHPRPACDAGLLGEPGSRPTRALRPGPLAGEKVLYTGDLFRSDEEGFLYFVGRKDDIIKSRGEKVAPEGSRERPLRACRAFARRP